MDAPTPWQSTWNMNIRDVGAHEAHRIEEQLSACTVPANYYLAQHLIVDIKMPVRLAH